MPPVTPAAGLAPTVTTAAPGTTSAPDASTTPDASAPFDPLAAAEQQAASSFESVTGASFKDMPKEDNSGGLTHLLGTLVTKGKGAALAELGFKQPATDPAATGTTNASANPPATFQVSAANIPVVP